MEAGLDWPDQNRGWGEEGDFEEKYKELDKLDKQVEEYKTANDTKQKDIDQRITKVLSELKSNPERKLQTTIIIH